MSCEEDRRLILELRKAGLVSEAEDLSSSMFEDLFVKVIEGNAQRVETLLWRVSFLRDDIKIVHLANAGLRGQQVDVLRVKGQTAELRKMGWLPATLMLQIFDAVLDDASLGEMDDIVRSHESRRIRVERELLRGIDVLPFGGRWPTPPMGIPRAGMFFASQNKKMADYSKQLVKLLQRLKKEAGAVAVVTNVSGTGDDAYLKQVIVTFGSGSVIDLWIQDSFIEIGRVFRQPVSVDREIPDRISFSGKDPKQVYEDLAPLLAYWGER